MHTKLLKLRLTLLKPALTRHNARALRTAIWSPMPWESTHGHLSTLRLEQLLSDLRRLLRANGMPYTSEDEERVFEAGLELLKTAAPKQLDKVLSTECARPVRPARHQATHDTECEQCGEVCRGTHGLRMT